MPLKLTGTRKAFAGILCLLVIFIAISSAYLLGLFDKSRDLNVVLITIDALRADHLGCYGYKRNTSPNIDALSREGALFTQAIAQSSHTPPSIGVIATSTYPPANQLRNWGDTLRQDIPTLAETLKAHGYRTLFLGTNDAFQKGLLGFDRGFDSFHITKGHSSAATTDALALVAKNSSRPFFLWVHYMDVHDYNPSEELKNLFVNDAFYDRQSKLPIVKSSPANYGHNGISEYLAKKEGGIDNPDYYVALYDAAIRTVDEQIELLLRELKRMSANRKLLVILTSDHGEMMGEHGFYFFHAVFLYQPLLKVPLILYCPGLVPSARIDAPVRAGLDVFSTILGVLKIKKHAAVQGANLMSVLSKKSATSASYILSDAGRNGGKKSVQNDEWKLTHSPRKLQPPGDYVLINLKKDPLEMIDVSSSGEGPLAFLKEKLREYYKRFPTDEKQAPLIDKDTREKLRAVGYLQ